jgi:organic radical activating enzyme
MYHNPYKTREGGATVSVFVPYNCNNNCPFCINKQEYEDMTGFSAESICRSIAMMDSLTPRCDFVFTGGEPLANLESLQKMLDCVPETHRVFINTTLPLTHSYGEDEVVDFLNRNKAKITCINVSRHLFPYVEESNDHIFTRLEVPARINCVLVGGHDTDKLLHFVRRFSDGLGLPVQFRMDYTKTTPENLYDESDDAILKDLDSIFEFVSLAGCRIRCNYEFLYNGRQVSYHKTLPYSTITETGEDGRVYDVLYDIIVKQTGEIRSDWDKEIKLDLDAYKDVVFEPSDMHFIKRKKSRRKSGK